MKKQDNDAPFNLEREAVFFYAQKRMRLSVYIQTFLKGGYDLWILKI